jgi:hypothetical protein
LKLYKINGIKIFTQSGLVMLAMGWLSNRGG